ncbi:MAG: L,D-transpeptidase [Chloroflexi bacterium]|nr:L,D-transpeptidase [Chloroflexota bacterium]
MNPKISRRDFLKLGGLGLAGIFAPPLEFATPFQDLQGRVAARMVWIYDRPSIEGAQVKLCPRDTLLPLTNTVLSDDVTSHNRVWYEVGNEGFVYSGNIQPVRTLLNEPLTEIPKRGLLAEVSVPFTDGHRSPRADSEASYRMYYETTHWILSSATDRESQVWYEVRDDKYNESYYARAEHFRILTEEEMEAISPDAPKDEKKIQVRLEEQVLIAFEYGKPVFAAPVSTGGVYRVGTYTTPRGIFATYYKRPSRHMAAGDIAASGFDLPGVPWVQYITESGISIHGTFWHNDFGRPRSHGCINLSIASAKWLYRWTTPRASASMETAYDKSGTTVEILL